MSLEIIAELSRFYGADERFVLAGGGNTSFKDEKFLYVKPSGVALADIEPAQFVKLDRSIVKQSYALAAIGDVDERERRIGALLTYAALNPAGARPSVESPLHDLLPYKFVVHTHPLLVNAMTCGVDGKAAAAELFPEALWMDYCDPGVTLAVAFKKAVEQCAKAPQVVFLANHGVFVAADTAEEIKSLYDKIMAKLAAFVEKRGIALESAETPLDAETVFAQAPVLRGLLGTPATVTAAGPRTLPAGALTPDHIVYAGSDALVADAPDKEAVEQFKAAHGGAAPKVVLIPGKALFGAGPDKRSADRALKLAVNGVEICRLAAAFGGVRYLTDAQRSFIEHWEAESYRANAGAKALPLRGKVAVVTGGAQGFGLGIAQYLARQGADVVIADMNVEGAKKAAASLGPNCSGMAVNVSDEPSVAALTAEIVKAYGGTDILVANAGVVRAGSVKSFEFKDWKFVTDVNYIGYFLCCKHFAALMSRQNAVSGLWTDIVQVNSKSGLVGSKNNGAYAGSKFGSIGLTQSFALELVADHVKVNSICPGNFFDGPLWSDPVKGLFVQYLNSGKVPGAKTTADVKKHYESLIPMHRGCTPDDVAKAICYVVQQQYETGQAVPVTGGQVMLS